MFHFCAMKILTTLITVFLLSNWANAQTHTAGKHSTLTNEDSLNTSNDKPRTVISGYGSISFQRDFNAQNGILNLDRAVLFVGHQFNRKISFFSELEIEDAKVSGGDVGGEVAMEQAYLKFNLSPTKYLVAGLFIPRIGLINENHLPVNFNGVERPIVEQLIIPATWREIGIGFYGRFKKAPLDYSLALVNGLNAEGFEHGSGLREGRFEGRNASINSFAFTAALQYYYKNLIVQVSGYAGGSNNLNKRASDSLDIHSGPFSFPVYLTEADIRWSKKGFNVRALGTYIGLPDASEINKTYANNTPHSMYGAYAEVAYNLFENSHKMKGQQLNVFGRYEMLDLNASIPDKGIYDGTVKQQHILAGFSYLPISNVVIKADVRLFHTGEENPALVINPSPIRLPYKQNNQFLNIGIGYSF